MTEAKHSFTPGPWITATHGLSVHKVTPEGLMGSAVCLLMSDYRAIYNYKANGRLIAAAPAMYEALQDMLLWLDDGNRILSDSCAADVAKARAALALARGEA